jgi:hypothetical protein
MRAGTCLGGIETTSWAVGLTPVQLLTSTFSPMAKALPTGVVCPPMSMLCTRAIEMASSFTISSLARGFTIGAEGVRMKSIQPPAMAAPTMPMTIPRMREA